MKTLFVDQLTESTGKLIDYFQVAQLDRKTKKDNQPYWSLKLRDRTGEVDAKWWDPAADLEVSTGDVVKVEAVTQTYRDSLQLNIKRLRKAEPGEVVKEDYIPASTHDRKELFDGLASYIGMIRNRCLGDSVFALCCDVRQELQDAPAAKGVHQAYLGGLLEHILQLCKLVVAVCECYPELDRDVMLAGAIVHDIGKIHELCYEDHIGYTRAGTLTGHIIQGSILWARYSGNLDPAARDHVQHIIASHHGQKEWGAAVLPITREAQIFHSLDLIDSRYEMVTNALADGVDADGMTGFVPKLGSQVWNGK
jgi:3'-5' exoribonuclease